MAQFGRRGGKAPIRTALELALTLPIPLVMIVNGQASALFPKSDRSNPSSFVTILPTKPPSRDLGASRLPIYVDGEQWERVVVPLLANDERVSTWRGVNPELGRLIALLNAIVGVDGSVVYPIGYEIGLATPSNLSVGRLYACDAFSHQRVDGKLANYLRNLAGLIFDRASQEGY